MRRDHWIEIFRSTGCANRTIPPSQFQKDDDMRAPLGRLNRMVKTRIFPSRTLACLASSPSRSSPMQWPAFALRASARQPSLASRAKAGGADRDRTDDLKLAKLALSQLSYGPRNRFNLACRAEAAQESPPSPQGAPTRQPSLLRSAGWWARDELNVRPHAYQACALTT